MYSTVRYAIFSLSSNCGSCHIQLSVLFSVTVPTGTVPSKPFTSVIKPTVRLRSDLKLKLAKQRTEDEERRRRQAAALSGSQPNVTQATLSTSLNESSRPSIGTFSIPVIITVICPTSFLQLRQLYAFAFLWV
jgi:hypothetical protein